MATTSPSAQTRATSTATLGALWLLYGIYRLMAVILLVLYAGTATVMFGALLTRVADYPTFMSVFHILYIFAIIVTALSSLFALLAGVTLLAAKSARTLVLIAAFLSLHDLPFGTTLGIYTLIVFLP
jgi:hypothetical protein